MDHDLRKLYFSALEKEQSELLDPETKMLSMEYSKIVDCPLCGINSKQHQQLFIKKGFTFVRCEHCEMIFANPQENQDLLGELYGQSKANDIWVEIQESKKEQSWKRKYYLDNLELLDELIGAPPEH